MGKKSNRKLFTDHVHKQLTGRGLELPNDELIGENPLDRFVTGFLFPIVEAEEEFEESGEEEEKQDSEEIRDFVQVSATKKSKRYIPPSSVGFSFFVSGDDIKLRVFYNAVCYKKEDIRDHGGRYTSSRWKKVPLTDDQGDEVVFTLYGLKQYEVFKTSNEPKGSVQALWRPYANGYIVTITLLNDQKLVDTDDAKTFVDERNSKTLFNIELACIIDSGELNTYPAKDQSLLSDEEKEVELRYKDKHVYAVGHGAAANWKQNAEGKREIFADFIPLVEVPQVTANTAGKDNTALSFKFLSDYQQREAVVDQLNVFVTGYSNWVASQNNRINDESSTGRDTASRIVSKQHVALQRMQDGIRMLDSFRP